MEQKNIPEIDRNTAKSLFELARAASMRRFRIIKWERHC